MARGIVASGNHRVDATGMWHVAGSIDDSLLRQYLTYWDSIVHVRGNGISFDETGNSSYTTLRDEGILRLAQCDIEVEVRPEDEGAEQHINGIPLEYWVEIFYHQRYSVALALNEQPESDEYWSIGQIGMDSLIPWTVESTDAVQLEIVKGLPVPSAETPIEDILAFKERRAPELLRFRAALDELSEEVTRADCTKRAIVRAQEHLDLALFDLHRVLDETTMQKVVTTVRTILGFEESQPLKYGLVGLAGLTGGALALHLQLALLAGLGVSGAINIVARRTAKELTLPSEVRDFVYLYHVQSDLKGS